VEEKAPDEMEMAEKKAEKGKKKQALEKRKS